MSSDARRTCAFCEARFPQEQGACPDCGYPVGGDFDRWEPRSAPIKALKALRGTKRPDEPCPHCGKPFPAARRACPHCGSCAETGWKPPEDQDHDGADLGDAFTDEDYREAVADLPGGRAGAFRGRRGLWRIAGIVLVLAMVVPLLVLLARLLR